MPPELGMNNSSLINNEKPSNKGLLQNRQVFEAYWSVDCLLDGIKVGSLVLGTLRICSSNPSFAFVTPSGLYINPLALYDRDQRPLLETRDILVCGRQNRNRSFNGDYVVVEFLPQEHWTKDAKSAGKFRPTARVVWAGPSTEGTQNGRCIPCYLKDHQSSHRFIKGVPCNDRDSSVLIPWNENCKFAGQAMADPLGVFSVRIRRWAEDCRSPLGVVESYLGSLGGAAGQVKYLMLKHMLDREQIPVLRDEVKSPPSCYQNGRFDFRDYDVITIDPATARDLDDAIHIIKHPSSSSSFYYEIGIHIADVSEYVIPDSELDKLAQERLTSIYFPTTVFPMLPRELCDDKCSLVPNVDRLAFSVIVYLDEEGRQYKEPQFTKSIIRSKCKLSYEMVQDIIDGKVDGSIVSVNGSLSLDKLGSIIEMLNRVAGKLRKSRLENGSLTFNHTSLAFVHEEIMNEEAANCPQLVPVELNYDEYGESHQLIEELMLMANCLVCYETALSPFKHLSVIRRHANPSYAELVDQLDPFLSAEEKSNFKFTSKGLSDLLKRKSKEFGENAILFMEQFIMSGLTLADYVAVGAQPPTPIEIWSTWRSSFNGKFYFDIPPFRIHAEEDGKNPFHHFALNFILYTHFTSPIRRYPDIAVHRTLDLCCQLRRKLQHLQQQNPITEYYTGIAVNRLIIDSGIPDPYQYSEQLDLLMKKANKMREASRKMEDDIAKTWINLYLSFSKRDTLIVKGIVLSIKTGNTKTKYFINVYIPQLHLSQSIPVILQDNLEVIQNFKDSIITKYQDKILLPLQAQLDENQLEIQWSKKDNQEKQYFQQIQIAQLIKCIIFPPQVPKDKIFITLAPE